MLRDDEGNLAWHKVMVFYVVMGTFGIWIGVNVGIAAGWWKWAAFEGSLQWGSSAFLGSSFLMHVGHRYTHKPKGDR